MSMIKTISKTKMTNFHDQTLELADEGFIKKQQGLYDEAKILFEQAYHLEYQAALEIEHYPDREPSYTILMNSAKALAELAGLELF
jgi:hypothetical protein